MTNKEYLESLSESELEKIIYKRPWFPYVKNYVLSSPKNCRTDGIKKWLGLIYSGFDGADYSKKAILEREANNYFGGNK